VQELGQDSAYFWACEVYVYAYHGCMPIYFRLRELRTALGITQAELARRAGVRRATISRLENARVSAIDLMVLERVAEVLAVEPGFLLTRVEPMRRSFRARRV